MPLLNSLKSRWYLWTQYGRGTRLSHNTGPLHRVNARPFALIFPQFLSLCLHFLFFFFFCSVEFRQLFQLFRNVFITNLFAYGVVFLKPVYCASSYYFRMFSWSKNSCLLPVFSCPLFLAIFFVVFFFFSFSFSFSSPCVIFFFVFCVIVFFVSLSSSLPRLCLLAEDKPTNQWKKFVFMSSLFNFHLISQCWLYTFLNIGPICMMHL